MTPPPDVLQDPSDEFREVPPEDTIVIVIQDGEPWAMFAGRPGLRVLVLNVDNVQPDVPVFAVSDPINAKRPFIGTIDEWRPELDLRTVSEACHPELVDEDTLWDDAWPEDQDDEVEDIEYDDDDDDLEGELKERRRAGLGPREPAPYDLLQVRDHRADADPIVDQAHDS